MTRPGAADTYHVVVQGQLSPAWAEQLQGASIRPRDDGTTLLVVQCPDQPALHGVLAKIRDLNLPLLSVYRLDPATRVGDRTCSMGTARGSGGRASGPEESEK